ncbi:S8 family peptidase [Aquincola sp. MAHUQ-54]|uniref:S8 family peptidase n=1 Tax=Aquincola agrisoli TaxID=3119538 RepID=A0AAW9Q7U6_9BURK
MIVQLRDAPSHGVDRAVTLSANAAAARAEAARWERVVLAAATDAGQPPPTRMPTGRAAYLLRSTQPLSAEAARRWTERLAAQPEVAWAVPNDRERRLQVPNDPMYAGAVHAQWWLHAPGGSDGLPLASRLRGVPGFRPAWQRHTGLPAVAAARVAVLDTGITAHPELAGHTLGGHDFVTNPLIANDADGRDADPTDPGDWVDEADRTQAVFRDCIAESSSWHGTMTAGMLAAGTHNAAGVAAVHWDGRVVPVRVAGKCGADVADIIDGLRWAAGLPVPGVPSNPHPARIVSLSFGGSGACNAAYQQAIDEVRARGVVLVAAAGNEHTALTRPANCRGVVGVVALNRDGFKTTYSNFGPEAVVATVGGDNTDGAWGGLLADGGLLSIYNSGVRQAGEGGYAYLFGSSFAAPVVAGTVSLMLGVHPAMTVDQIVEGLRASARPHVQSALIGLCSPANPGRCLCTAATCGAGILDADEALRYAQELAAGRGYVRPAGSAAVLDSAELRQAAALGPDRPANPAEVTSDPRPAAEDGSGGGGGGSGPGALLALAAAAAMLRRRPAVAQRCLQVSKPPASAVVGNATI